MALRISRAMTITQTAAANKRPPAMIHPVVTAVPRKHTIANEMPPIQIKHEASKRIRILDGCRDEINND